MCKLIMVLVQRAARFSPNNVENDAGILESVSQRLVREGYHVVLLPEEKVEAVQGASAYMSMGRSEHTLSFLTSLQINGTLVVNASEGIGLCNHRVEQMQLLESHGIPVAPLEGTDGYWVKRGDGPSEIAEDIAFALTKSEALVLQEKMLRRGITAVEIRAHVKGDLVKFYGVHGTTFFRYYYPGDDGHTKFGHEERNGAPVHYPFDEDLFCQTVNRAAVLHNVEVYGGDAVIRADGSFALVDFNDWPGFSRCREEAAQAIVERLGQLVRQ